MKNRKDGPMLKIVSAVTIFSILIYGFWMLFKLSFLEYLDFIEEERREEEWKEKHSNRRHGASR